MSALVALLAFAGLITIAIDLAFRVGNSGDDS